MKKHRSIAAILLLTSLSSFASETKPSSFSCETSYQTKIAHLHKTRELRQIGRYAAIIAPTTAAIVGLFATLGPTWVAWAAGDAHAGFVLFMGLLGRGGLSTLAVAGDNALVDATSLKEDKLFAAYLTLQAALVTTEDLKNANQEKWKAKQLALSQNDEYVVNMKKSINQIRSDHDFPPLTYSEVVEIVKNEPFVGDPNEGGPLYPFITELSEKLDGANLDYETVRLKLVQKMATEEFCVGNKPLTYGRLLKEMANSK